MIVANYRDLVRLQSAIPFKRWRQKTSTYYMHVGHKSLMNVKTYPNLWVHREIVESSQNVNINELIMDTKVGSRHIENYILLPSHLLLMPHNSMPLELDGQFQDPTKLQAFRISLQRSSEGDITKDPAQL